MLSSHHRPAMVVERGDPKVAVQLCLFSRNGREHPPWTWHTMQRNLAVRARRHEQHATMIASSSSLAEHDVGDVADVHFQVGVADEASTRNSGTVDHEPSRGSVEVHLV